MQVANGELARKTSCGRGIGRLAGYLIRESEAQKANEQQSCTQLPGGPNRAWKAYAKPCAGFARPFRIRLFGALAHLLFRRRRFGRLGLRLSRWFRFACARCAGRSCFFFGSFLVLFAAVIRNVKTSPFE